MIDPTEFRNAWLKALRSGKYAQGQAYLSQGLRFCCLGVACEVARDMGMELKKEPSAFGTFGYGNERERRSLPPEMRPLFSQVFSGESMRYLLVTSELITMNDCGRNFLEIANFIEDETL